MSEEIRRIAAQEFERQKQADAFWAALYRDFPQTRNHKELAKALLQKNMAKMGDMGADEGVEFLGNAVVTEINRRARVDAESAEANVYGGTGAFEHGHTMDSRTGETHSRADSAAPEENEKFGDVIRRRREARRNAHKNFERSSDGDRREHRHR